MSSKLRISNKASSKLESLSNRLALRKNIICRLAVGRSLNEKKSIEEFETQDSSGYEFNRYTITGEHDGIYKALIVQYEKKKLDDKQYFTKYLRNHMERGIDLLYEEYEKINSPVEFLLMLSKS